MIFRAKTFKLLATLSAAMMLLSVNNLCVAQEAVPDFYKEPGLYPNRDYVNQHATERVDPFTGALQVHSTDVHVPGNGGFDLRVVRSYNTGRINAQNPADLATSSLAGMGWTVHFGRVLKNGNTNICVNTDGGTATKDNPVLELPDGSRQILSFPSNGSPLLLSGQQWKGECLGAGTGLSIFSPDGVRYDMTQQVAEVGGARPLYAWYTTRITDRNGNTATVKYAGVASPEISEITASDGRIISFSYNDQGTLSRRISAITSAGRTWNYNYTALSGVNGRYFLTSVTRPDGTKWRYDYNSASSSDLAKNYQLLRITYPQGGAITYGYDYVYFDSVTNPESRTVVVTSKSTSDGGNWSFAYDPGSTNTLDTTTVKTPSGIITYKHFGANYASSGQVWRIGLLQQKITGSIQTEKFTWGPQKISDENNLRQGAFPSRIDTEFYAPILIERQIVRDGVAYTTKYSNHDTYGNPGTISEAGPKGGTRVINITYENDPKLWLIRQVYDETTVGVGRVSTRRDTHGNVRSVTRDGVTTSYSYTSAGDVETIVRPRTLTSRYSDYHRGSPQQEQHEEGVKISRNVNSAGNVTSETNGEGATTQYEYDGLSRVTKITPPLGYPTIISYTATSKTATRGSAQEVTTFDAFARPVAITVGGQSLAAKYDSLGRKVFASHFGYPTAGNSFAYDILDRLQKVTHSADQSFRQYTYGASGGAPTLAVRDERNFTTVHTYRGYGDPDQMLLMEVDAPVSTANVSLNRNGRGLVTDYTQAGFTRRFAFDSRYYLTSTFHPEVGTTTYGRDDAGNMTSRKVGNSGSTVFEYDRRNRLKYVTYPNNNPAKVTKEYYSTDRLKSVSNGVATRVLVYDKNINLTSESIAIDGLSMEAKYRYDANDHMSAITYPVLNRVFELNPDQFGRAKTITAPTGTMLSAAYWPNGQVYEVAYAGGSRATYGQNSRGQMDSITIQTGDSVNHVASTLRRDVAGNIYRIDDTANSYTFNRGYEYDGINRLTTVNGFWGNGQVSYDGAGNIRSYTLGTMSQKAYTYDTSNRLSSVRSSDPGGALETSYSYDEYGNANLVQDEYVYDAANNMTSGPPGIRRAYDGDNVRVRSSSAGAVTYEFRSVSGALLAEWTKESGYLDILKEHLHISGKPVAEQRTHFVGTDVRTPTWMFLQHDHNGSPISATWAGGGLLFKQSYQPYGEDSDSSGGYTKLGFTGATQDTANLSYMGRRYYNPKIGRFLSIDPEEADPADIHSYNRYAYANNNPNRYVDPDGASPITLEQLARVDATVNVYQHCGNSQCIQSSLTQMVMVRDSLRADGVDLQDRSALGANIGQASMLVGQQAEVFRAVGEAGIVGLSQGASKTGPIRNAHLAGSVHPFTKIPFDKQGYPDFSSVAKATVKIAQTGNRAGDARAANKAAGYQSTPEGYQWHHHQDKTTMQLVPQWHHQKTGHDGGYTGK